MIYIYLCFLSATPGKMFGTERDYLIAEAEYPEGEGEEEEEEEGGDEGDGGGRDGGEGDDEGSEEEKDEPPKSEWKPPPTVLKEDAKTGVNKKTYFVCNERKSGALTMSPFIKDAVTFCKTEFFVESSGLDLASLYTRQVLRTYRGMPIN